MPSGQGRANLDSVWSALGSRRLAAGCGGSGRGLTAGRSLGPRLAQTPLPHALELHASSPNCLKYDILPPLDAGPAPSEATPCCTFYRRTEELWKQFSPEVPNFLALKSIRCLHSEEILEG
jgi:hypothetical protein